MSYMSVQHVVNDLLGCQRLFRRWVDKQNAAADDPGSQMLLSKVAHDARIREESLREALDRWPKDVLTTQLQYESVGDVQAVVDALPDQLPDRNPASVIDEVSEYYGAVTETLKLCARESRASNAKEMLSQMAEDTESVVASEAWMARDE